jgi:hypothetical protein
VSLRDFIQRHHEEIIVEFAAFAKTLMPPGTMMTDAALRDHAAEILTEIAIDMGTTQSVAEQSNKSRGLGALNAMRTSGRLHADARIAHGFPMTAVLAEFRALRHTILPLYEESGATARGHHDRHGALGHTRRPSGKTREGHGPHDDELPAHGAADP